MRAVTARQPLWPPVSTVLLVARPCDRPNSDFTDRSKCDDDDAALAGWCKAASALNRSDPLAGRPTDVQQLVRITIRSGPVVRGVRLLERPYRRPQLSRFNPRRALYVPQAVSPLTVENPFIKKQPVQSVPVSSAAQPTTLPPTEAPSNATPPTPEVRTPIPVVGAIVDADAPVAYRLPAVSSFAPTPVDASTGPAPRAVLPPQPPSLEASTHVPFSTGGDAEYGPEVSVPESETPNMREADATDTGPWHERSLLQHDLSVSDLPLPPVAEDAAPQGPSPDVERNNGSPVESISPVAPAYTPTANELTSQLLPAVQRGYDLAQRGALFAAQTEFVQVLRRVAQAKDAASRSDEHSRALAAGLRALDEAEDFVPAGHPARSRP